MRRTPSRRTSAAWSAWSAISTPFPGKTGSCRVSYYFTVVPSSTQEFDMNRRIFATLLLAAPLLTGCGYNRIQSLTQNVDAAQGQIQAQLQRRYDLIPNLVNTVKGYATHEEAVFTQVAQARSGLGAALQSGDAAKMANADASMTQALGRLMVTVEAYPQLKADQSFLRL